MTTIGGYELGDVLGDGGMGTVYKAVDPRFNRPVAIKVLHSHYLSDPAVMERFKTEAVIQARLKHPNIVSVYDFIADGTNAAIVMEYVEGPSLEEEIKKRGALPEAECVDLMSQVLDAVGLAHQQGLVHRDLKPSNILIERIGGRTIPKVTDFGIAKVLGNEKLRTATSAKMGTIYYMPPEQIRSPKNVDQRSDIYSLGVVLYEMCTGVLPFDPADSEYEMMRQTLEDAPRTVDHVKPSVSEGLAEAIDRALAKQPEKRFQDCKEFVRALTSPPSGVRFKRGVDEAPSKEADSRSSTVLTAPPDRDLETACPLCGRLTKGGRFKLLYGSFVCKKCNHAFANRRGGAYLIDIFAGYLLAYATAFFLGVLLVGAHVVHYRSTLEGIGFMWVLAFWLLWCCKDGFGGLSPGKAVCGVKAVSEHTGGGLSFGGSFRRNLPLLIPVVPLVAAFEMMKGHRIGDGWSKSRVIWKKYEGHPVFTFNHGAGTH